MSCIRGTGNFSAFQIGYVIWQPFAPFPNRDAAGFATNDASYLTALNTVFIFIYLFNALRYVANLTVLITLTVQPGSTEQCSRTEEARKKA